MKLRSRQPARGFTLIELIVAVSIMLLMMYMISIIFDQSRRAVGRGIATGDVIGNSKAASSHLAMDFEAMVGPSDNDRAPTASPNAGDASGGYLVIVHRTLRDLDDDGVLDGDSNGDGRLDSQDGVNPDLDTPTLEGVLFAMPNGQLERRHVRSDQLSFLASRASDQQPLVPANTAQFVPYDDDGAARYLRLWYGHVSRLNTNGSEFETVAPTADDDPLNDGHLGQPGADRFGNRFILGRQALFLGETAPPAATPATTYVDADGTVGIGPFAPVVNAGGGAVAPMLYRAFSDYAAFSYDDPGALGNNPRVVGEAANGNADPILAADRVFPNFDEYHLQALTYLTFANKRLRVNPQPNQPTWESWRVAQIHPYLMEYVSDFIVEFAGDYRTGHTDATPNLGIATFGTTGFNPDGQVDTGAAYSIPGGVDSYGRPAKDLEVGHIKWYTSPQLANHPWLAANVAGYTYDSTKPVTYPWPWAAAALGAYDDINPAGVYNPYYRVPNAARIHADTAFVFRHDDENGKFLAPAGETDNTSLWPYLLRIRYRLHDPRGELMSGLGQHGVWFEQIVSVRRPAATP